MKLFEELMDKTAKFADEAVKVGKEAFEQTKVVAGEAMEKGKKKVNQLQLESDMKDAQRKLGELVYLQHKTGEKNDELVAQYIADIEKIEAELDVLLTEKVNEQADFTVEDVVEEAKELVDELKETVTDSAVRVCKNCGAQAADTDIFCHDCGSKLE